MYIRGRGRRLVSEETHVGGVELGGPSSDVRKLQAWRQAARKGTDAVSVDRRAMYTSADAGGDQGHRSSMSRRDTRLSQLMIKGNPCERDEAVLVQRQIAPRISESPPIKTAPL